MEEDVAELNEAVRDTVTRAVPERRSELRNLWAKYNPVFETASDRGTFRLEGGVFNLVFLTPRSMWIVWLLTQEAWAAVNCYSSSLVLLQMLPRERLDRFREIIQSPADQPVAEAEMDRIAQSVDQLRSKIDISEFRWPSAEATPSSTRPDDLVGAALYDLASLAIAAMFLHEVHHLIATAEGGEIGPHSGEYNADRFAREFMMNRVQEYSDCTGDGAEEVASKRAIALGIYCFAIMRIGGENRESESHPAPTKRLRKMLEGFGSPAGRQVLACDVLSTPVPATGRWKDSGERGSDGVARVELGIAGHIGAELTSRV